MTEFEKEVINLLVSNPPVLDNLETPSAHMLDRSLGFTTDRSAALIKDFEGRRLITRRAKAVDAGSGGTPWWWEVGPRAISDIEQEAHVIIGALVKTYAPSGTPSHLGGL
jgi:hypothetical protein